MVAKEYSLETFHRSNQDTCLLHNPIVSEGDWVQTGDLLADCAASSGGELSLGKNILVAYMPWEGYNYEDAILISERLVYEDVYSSIHIERYDIEVRERKFGMEIITRNIPELDEHELEHLDSNGIAKVGSWIKEGDILVGRITPINKKAQSTYQNLLYTILDKSFSGQSPDFDSVRDSSLRAPKGIKAKVVNIQIYKLFFSKSHSIRPVKTKNSKLLAQNLKIENKIRGHIKQEKRVKSTFMFSKTFNYQKETLGNLNFLSYKKFLNRQKKTSLLGGREPLIKLCKQRAALISSASSKKNKENQINRVYVYLAEKRKIQVGDKMAGRHGNKGIVSLILPRQDMPFLSNGTPIDMVLNPLGVPSRMNVGQIYECLLGLAAKYLGEHYKIFPFDEIYGPEASRSFVYSKLYEARKKTGNDWLFDPNSPGKTTLFDGRTGDTFDQSVTVGYAYMLKLVHLVDDKIHCLTPDHDVLTSVGWLPIDQIRSYHQIATINNVGQLSYQYPTNIYDYPNYKGTLYHIKNQNLDLLVTLNHRMYVRKGCINGQNFNGYQLIEAEYLIGKHYRYLKNADWHRYPFQFILPSVISNSVLIPEKAVHMSSWLTFFGIWIAEGWATSNILKSSIASPSLNLSAINNSQSLSPLALHKAVYQVQISFCKPRVATVLYPAVAALGYSYTVIDEKLTIYNKQLYSYLKPLSLGAPNKSLPPWVWYLDKFQAQTLLTALCLGDGTLRGSSVSYYTSSIKLADDVMRLALHAGWSANKFFHLPKGHKSTINGKVVTANYDLWRISIIQAKNNPSVNHDHHKEQSVQIEEKISYEGPVYCVSVPNEVFYVRRNGFPVWTGNSRSTGPYSLVTQQPLRGRSKQGGQRLGEMEVWALEGYGAAFTLLEMLTIKSDDMTGRMTLWSNLILNKDIAIGTPESFKVLVCELQALCLDIGIFRIDSFGKLAEIESLTQLP
jgi:hypothetical protein